MRNLITGLVLFGVLLLGCASAPQPGYSVEPLPEYDALFTRTEGWTGADAVYSVALADDVTLWLYDDTWIGDIVDGKHKGGEGASWNFERR